MTPNQLAPSDIVLSGGQLACIVLTDLMFTAIISYAGYNEEFVQKHRICNTYLFMLHVCGLFSVWWLPLWSLLRSNNCLGYCLLTIVLTETFPFAWISGNFMQVPTSMIICGLFLFFSDMSGRDVSRANIYRPRE